MATTEERLQAGLNDRYLFEKELGRGGMAVVYLARDVKHDRKVAIKVLHPELAASIGAERFEREIKLAAKLSHPHILGLYDSGEVDGLFFYVMPFIEGEALRDRLDREGQLPIEDAIQITLEVADALGHAHKQGIVHRDIKPENVLLSEGHALVADFGIARAASESNAQKLTQTGMAVGTPVYMSPEQSVGETVGPTADLYSLGCMLYEMLAGEPPFTAKNAMALMARHAMEAVPSVRIVRNTVPEEIEDAIFAAMAKSPADRPQSAAQFAELLGIGLATTATYRSGSRHTTTRRAATQSYAALRARHLPWWRQRWGMAGIGGGAVLALFLGWFFGLRTQGPPPLEGGLRPQDIAVLYFEDHSRDGELGYLADGLTEGLMKNLGQVSAFTVISKSGVEPFRASGLARDSIARVLDVGTLVIGEVEQEGDNVRVSVQLVDGSGTTWDRTSLVQPVGAALGVADSLAQEVARLIQVKLGGEVQRLRLQRETNSPEAWSLVQRAEKLRKTGEAAAAAGDSLGYARDFAAADSVLALAEQQDPKWSEPVSQRAFLAYRRSRLTRDRALIDQWVSVGVPLADRAIALNPTGADAFEIRGNLKYWKWNMRLEPDAGKAEALLLDAQSDLEKATGLNRRQAGAWATLSHLYNQTKTAVDVNSAATRALEADAFLDNADVVLNRLFLSSYDLANFPDAGLRCSEIRRRFPKDFNAPRCELFMMTTTAVKDPDPARAWRLADSVTALAPEGRREYLTLNARMLVAATLARAGLADSAKAVVERSKGDAQINPTRDLTMFGAFVYRLLGDADGAVNLLKFYFAANDQLRQVYREDPGWYFRDIAATPAWKQLVGQ